MIYIYTLSDPRTGEIRYVGKTTKINKRFSGHLTESRRGDISHKCNWIRSLLTIGLKPVIEVLDTYDGDDWTWLEMYWISQFKIWGYNLTNNSEGGEDPPSWLGKTHSQKHKDKLSKLMTENNPAKNMNDEWRKNISEALKRVGHTTEVACEVIRKKVKQYTLDGEFIKEWSSMTEAAKGVGLKRSSGIGACCSGKRNKAGGYKWSME